MPYRRLWRKRVNKALAVILLGILFQLNAVTGYAVSDISPYSGGNLSIARCISKGGFDFGLFLDSVSYDDSFQEGLIEPWNDVLVRNQCQATDVIGLIKQEDKIRKSIRDAYLTCNTQKIAHLKSAYNKILVEIYYVRHVVDGGIVLSLPYELLSTRLGQTAAYTDRDKLFKDMYKKYVNANFFSEENFTILFNTLESKYKDRSKTYVVCSTGSWQAVKEKWDEFKKYFTEDLNKDLKQAGKSLGARMDNLKKEAKTIKTVELLTTDLSIKDYLKSFGQLNLNKFEAEEGAGQMGEFLEKSLPSFETAPSQNELLNAIEGAKVSFNTSKIQSDLSAEFQDLYFNFNDESVALILNNLDGRNVEEEGLIEIIQLSLPKLKALRDKSKTVNSRQCVSTK